MEQISTEIFPLLHTDGKMKDLFYTEVSTSQTTETLKTTSARDIWLISDDVIKFVYTINLAIICGVCSLFGITTNAINMAVFARMGFQETINISLMGLAISDMGSLITLLWVSACYNPFFMYSSLPVFTIELQHYTGGWTHVLFTRITGFITVFISLERCLCIAFPLKIKSMMTQRKVTIIIIFIYIFIIATMSQNYSVSYIDWKWVPGLNSTMLGIIFSEGGEHIENISHYIQMVYPVISFTSVVICTMIFVWKLNHRKKWRKFATAMATTKGDKNSTEKRDQQIIKMVVSVAIIFIVSYVPSLLLFTAISNMPETKIGRKYENVFVLFYAISFPLEAINSSVNIFVYYSMMSKYKAVFRALISGRCFKKENIEFLHTNKSSG